MNIKKAAASFLAAAIAFSAAASVAAASSTYALVPSENPEPGLSSFATSWVVQVYNTGQIEEGKPATNYDIDYSKVAKYSVTFTVLEEDRDFWDGNVGGALVLSMSGGDIPRYETDENGDPIYETDEDGNIVYQTYVVTDENGNLVEDENGETVKDFVLDENGEKIPIIKDHPLYMKYNWSMQQWWGVNDEELCFDTTVETHVPADKVGDYTYKVTANEYENPLANGDANEIDVMQICFADYSAFMCRFEVKKVDVMDSSDNILLSFDGNGKATVPAGEPDTSEPDTSEPDTSEPDTSGTPSFPSTTTPDDTSSAPESSDSTTDNTSTPDEKVEFAPEPVVDETVDEETAKVIAEIKVSAPEAAFEAGTKLAVKKDNSVDAENAFALDISFTLNGSSVQPKNGASVTVSIPVPPMFKDVNEDLLKVFHYLNGKYTRIEATVKNGTVTFDTTHFSTYVISPDDLTVNNPPESSTVTSETPNPSTGVAAVSALPIAAVVGAIAVISKKKK